LQHAVEHRAKGWRTGKTRRSGPITHHPVVRARLRLRRLLRLLRLRWLLRLQRLLRQLLHFLMRRLVQRL